METTNTQNRMEHLLSSMPFILALWGVFIVLYVLLKLVPADDYSGWVGFLYYMVVITTSTCYAIWAWRNSEPTAKRIIGYLALSFFCILCTALVYQLVFNVLRIPHSAMSNLALSLYNVPYTGFLVLQLLGWGGILYINNKGKSGLSPTLYTPVIIISLSCLSLFFLIFGAFNLQNWSEGRFLLSSYDLIQAFLQIISFSVAILCLSITKNKGIFYIAISCLLITAVDTVLNFGIFSQSYGTGSILEIFWILGCLLSVYGLVSFKKEGAFKSSPKTWMYKLDEPRAQKILWAVSYFIIGAYIASTLAYFMFRDCLTGNRLLQIMVSAFIFCLVLVAAMNNFNRSSIQKCNGERGS